MRKWNDEVEIREGNGGRSSKVENVDGKKTEERERRKEREKNKKKKESEREREDDYRSRAVNKAAPTAVRERERRRAEEERDDSSSASSTTMAGHLSLFVMKVSSLKASGRMERILFSPRMPGKQKEACSYHPH